MPVVEPRLYVSRLTPTATNMLNAAVVKASQSQHYEVTVEHLLLEILRPEGGDAAAILHDMKQDRVGLINRIEKILNHQRTGNTSRPVFSGNLWRWFEDTWVRSSLTRNEAKLRSGMLLVQMINNGARYSGETFPELENISPQELQADLDDIFHGMQESIEAGAVVSAGGGAAGAAGGDALPGSRGDSALGRFCTNITADVREGRIDPIFGRHREIRQMIDILCRRRKNNPIVVGEPGVGKTALAEGLAIELVANRVPDSLKNTELLGLDMGLLQAGASVKGEFENRLKAVINEVKSSTKPVILFIDEAHTLIGSGGKSGGNDASNLLKPALARGELRTVAATTLAEYKKYFEKDAALERRFQKVIVNEPSEEDAIVMLRGLKGLYEKSHGVRIKDEAVVAAVQLSNRYISGRLLPDKAVDLLDTTAARVRVSLSAKPEELTDLESTHAALKREIEALSRDISEGTEGLNERLEEAKVELEATGKERDALQARWEAEVKEAEAILAAREGKSGEAIDTLDGKEPSSAEAAADKAWEDAAGGAGQAPPESAAAAPPPMVGAPAEVTDAPSGTDNEESAEATAPVNEEDKLVSADVNSAAVARTVSSWTGIPLGKMQKDASAAALTLESRLENRVKGQEPAVSAVAEAVRMSYAGVRNPEAPVGVFLFVGPSGVGKTETALALADEFFGGERFITQINMSEFQEKHTVSRLIGSPPGYVGYGEGGVLTEAVRHRPYSVVLLDETEKAHPDVLNLFYQVFDKGEMNDGEGTPINFRNTMCILTSNLATDLIMEAYSGGKNPHYKEVVETIQPVLSNWFKPALLARMTVIPYRPIDPETMRLIARMKLRKLGKIINAAHGIPLTATEDLVEELARRCTNADTGARNVDHILRGSVTPMIARELLEIMARGEEPAGIELSLAPSGDWRVEVEVA